MDAGHTVSGGFPHRPGGPGNPPWSSTVPVSGYHPGHGFRTFLLTLLQRFLSDELAGASALKRGGGERFLSLDELAMEDGRPFEPSTTRTPEQEFDRRWALATLDNVLRRNGALFESVQGLLAGGGDHGEIARTAVRLGLGESALKMRLGRWRVRYPELIREEVAQTVPRLTDLGEEMKHLLRSALPAGESARHFRLQP